MKINFLSVFLPIVFLGMVGCASPPPLPKTLHILPPLQDVPSEIAAFTGIWEGKWAGLQDTIIVIENINTTKAEMIISYGSLVQGSGFKPPDTYWHLTANVLPGPILEFYQATELTLSESDKYAYVCPCKATFEIDRKTNILIATWEYVNYNTKVRADLKRRK